MSSSLVPPAPSRDGAVRDAVRDAARAPSVSATGLPGFTLWLTGLSGAGKSTLAGVVAASLRELGHPIEVLDGDEIRENLSKGLGFSREDRDTNVRRIGYVAKLLSRHGVGVITAAISPYQNVRDDVRATIPNFLEVHVDASVDECARRDVKGLYRRAFAGEIPQFTGVSDPYEVPVAPELVVRTEHESVDESAERVIALLRSRGLLPAFLTHECPNA